MKKIIITILTLAVGFPLLLGAMELDNKNLKDLKYTRIQCEFNGIAFYKGYKSTTAQKMTEFNLEEIKTALSEAAVPININDIRGLYKQMESGLKKAGIGIMEIRKQDEKGGSTILPMVSIAVEVLEVSKESYAALVYLTVSKWMSTWAGTRNIHTPVITWWQKKMIPTAPEDLNKTIKNTAKDLIDEFIMQFADANTEKEEEETTEEIQQKN